LASGFDNKLLGTIVLNNLKWNKNLETLTRREITKWGF
jgi:hypothetical protein